ncbi:MAG: hypothetical protein QNJ98_02995 [Planctomycetota bacterium]|nr:hypothetical protein [Planctomycetota bacterium]
MRTPTLLLVLSLASLVLSGCLEADEKVTLKADGSGTIRGTYVADMPKFKELIDMAKMLAPQQPGAPELGDVLPNPFHRSWFERSAKGVKGLDITGGETQEKNDKRTTTVEAAFTSLEAAAKGGAFFASSVTLKPYKPKSDKKGAARKPVTTGEGGGDGGDGDDGADRPKAWKLTLEEAYLQTMGGFEPQQILPAFEQQLTGATIKRTITFPAKVIETNGKLAEDGLTVTWTVTYDDIIEGKDLSMIAVFENTEAMKLESFSYAPDILTLMPRFTEVPPGLKAKPKDEPKDDAPKKAPTTDEPKEDK